jgi:CheY-like chemotaxis protein
MGETLNSGRPPSDHPRVLVVDDSTTVRHLSRMAVERLLALQVDEAVDGLDALEKVRKNTYALVVTDIMMPRMDGLGLIRAIRETLKSDVPILVVTTRGNETDQEKALSVGADAYLAKPFTAASLAAAAIPLLNRTRE